MDDDIAKWEREDEQEFDAKLFEALVRAGATSHHIHLSYEEMAWLVGYLGRAELWRYNMSPHGGPLYLASPTGAVKVTYD